MRARIEPVAVGEDLDIPMPAMTPAYRMGAQRRGVAMDPATRRLAIFAAGIGGALVLLVGVWSFTGHHHAGVPVIEADSRPLRVKPANPGGLQVAGANDSILSGESDATTAAMAPPPETPAPQALKAEEQAAAVAAVPPPPAAAPPQAVEPPRPVAAPEAKLKPVPLTPPVAPRPAVMASARPAPAHSELGAAARPVAGGAVVQLAALESEDAAKAEWRRLEHRYGDLLGGHAPVFSRVEHAGKTFWRVRTAGFTDAAQAVLFCQRVKEKGGGCSVASF